MPQRDSRWWKINDTKSLADTGLHFLKENSVNSYLLKKNNTKNIESHWHLRKLEHLYSWQESRRTKTSARQWCTCWNHFPSCLLWISPYSRSHIPSSSFLDLAWAGGDLYQPRVLLLFTTHLLQEILQQSKTTLKQKQMEGNMGEQWETGKCFFRKYFMITFINSSMNQIDTMRFYLRPIRLAVIQKKYILHSDRGDVEKDST